MRVPARGPVRWMANALVFVGVVVVVYGIVRVVGAQIRSQTLAIVVAGGLTLWFLLWFTGRGERR